MDVHSERAACTKSGVHQFVLLNNRQIFFLKGAQTQSSRPSIRE
jgi:hypothetical protein